ncbi:MAG: histidine--tRNA ligase [Nitrospirae bacterium]|nr:histidine--tRNA ligase [Nitrospirota bacterium]
MRDVLPPDIYIWQKLEKTAFEVLSRYGFREMRTPVVESTALFSRGIGEATDIVEKEMYTFEDKGGRSLTLRPEGTASAVRCYVENQLYNLPSPQKYYYWGPMFRYERPQAGRYRQFYQLGVEAFGSDSPALDAELLSMLRHFLLKSGLEGLNFQINSIGCRACRPDFIKALLEYLGAGLEGLCADCRRRYSANPLRILDCKASGCQELRKGAPRVTDHLCDGCHDHFDKFQHYLKLLDVPFSLNHEMVRGLDYYTRTTFEVTSENLGAQNAVTAGGRYDGLVREFGGPDTPAFGFAVGMERLVELLRQAPGQDVPRPGIFIAVIGERAHSEALLTAEVLRADGSWVEVGEHTASLKNQLRKADRLSAEYVFIIGDEELDAGSIKWKRLSDSASGSLPAAGVRSFLSGRR